MNLEGMIIDNTPVERYIIEGHEIFVKREDLCAQPPLPPFSKVRGLLKHLEKLKAQGIRTVGYTESSISMAGIGVAAIGRALGLAVVLFDPQYKETPKTLLVHRRWWAKFNPVIVPVKAGMVKVNFNISRAILRERYGEETAVMLPLGLPFEETIEETAKEVDRTPTAQYRTLVVNVGSGTICAGIVRGMEFENAHIYGIMGRTGDVTRKRELIIKKSRVFEFPIRKFPLTIVDPGYQYTQPEDYPCPFPCHAYYDRKSFRFMMENIDSLEPPILFWNIGK